MALSGIFDRTIGVLQKVLDLRVRNQQIISSNLANIDTPGYSAARLTFEEDLAHALNQPVVQTGKRHPDHFAIGGQEVEQVQGQVLRVYSKTGLGDGNGVDIDQEMIAQAENQILFEAATQMLNKKLGLLKYVAQADR
ncbi:MAG: flagellar basal body rod protein FlgB [Syntrophotaleaceae bacterium]